MCSHLGWTVFRGGVFRLTDSENMDFIHFLVRRFSPIKELEFIRIHNKFCSLNWLKRWNRLSILWFRGRFVVAPSFLRILDGRKTWLLGYVDREKLFWHNHKELTQIKLGRTILEWLWSTMIKCNITY